MCVVPILSHSSLNFVNPPSKHPSARIEERLDRSGQSEEAPAHAGATDQPSEANAGQAAALQFPRVLADDRSRSEISGEQESLPVLQAGLGAQGQDVW